MQQHNRHYGNSIMKESVPMVITAVPHKCVRKKGGQEDIAF